VAYGNNGVARDDNFAAPQALELLDFALASANLPVGIGCGQQPGIVCKRCGGVEHQREVALAQASLADAHFGVAG
jgi:hypothetical protein